MIKKTTMFSGNKFTDFQFQTAKARAAILKMTTLAGSGHPGGSMSTIDFLMVLLKLANIKPEKPQWENRDRIVISHGHVSPAVYSALGISGFFDLDAAISQFRLAGSIFEGHVEPDVPGIEWASGNLGQGLSAGCGFALACRMKGLKNRIFVLMGDGEQQKGQISEARRFAVKYKLKNLIGFVDFNGLQICGKTTDVMPQDIKANYLSDGWQVLEIDGHDPLQIEDAILEAISIDKPVCIMAHTVMGKGVSFMENKEKYHGSTISEEQLDLALKELNQNNNLEQYKILRKEFINSNKKQTSGTDFNFDPGSFREYEVNNDNRSAWGKAIADIMRKNPDAPIAIFDCDLQGSVKTKEFEEIVTENFFQSGIMEHHTAVMAGAMSRENIQVFFADFGVFGIDETYNQHRLNDINNTNLKIIATHVGLDVGEDGKTHQCLDYIGLIRNLFNFKLIIPGDANQTDHIIRYLVNKYGNYLVPMGRSKIDILQRKSGEIYYNSDYRFEYGKVDLLRDGNDGAILTCGTLTGKALEISNILAGSGINLQVWNVSCPLQPDTEALKKAASTGIIFTYEDHNINTGLGSITAENLNQLQLNCKLVKFGIRTYAFSGTAEDVYKMCGLDVDSMIRNIREYFS